MRDVMDRDFGLREIAVEESEGFLLSELFIKRMCYGRLTDQLTSRLGREGGRRLLAYHVVHFNRSQC